MNYIRLDLADIAIAASLVVLNGGLSLVLGLGVERRLAIAAVRMVVQLLLVGLVLKALFQAASPWVTAGVALIMLLVSGREVMARQTWRLSGLWGYGVGAGAMTVAAVTVTVFALTTQIRPDPWYDPRYAIPLLGMVLGNAMTGVGLGLDTVTSDLALHRGMVEARLALGERRWPAVTPLVRKALRTALMPIINTMAATGVVALPGMMTGQILGGVEPVEAVKYQILILFLLAGGTGLGAAVAVLGGVWRLTDRRHRIRLDRMRQR